MKFIEVFKDSFTYPFKGTNIITEFLLFVGSFLIIPGLMGVGYKLRIIESTINGSDELPPFKDYGDLLEKGVLLIGASIVYNIPLYIIIVALLMSGNLSVGFSGGFFTIITAIIGFFISIILTLALVNMVAEGRFKAVFDFKKVFELIKNIGWGKYLSFLIVYFVIFQILGLIILLLTSYVRNGVLGFIIYFLVLFLFYAFTYMVSGRFSGLLYSNAIGGKEIESDYPE